MSSIPIILPSALHQK